MSALTKMLGAATKLTQGGRVSDAAQLIREGLADFAEKTAAQAAAPKGSPDDRDPFACFGPTSGFDFARGWAGLSRQNARTPAATASSDGAEADLFETRQFSSPAGSRAYKLFVPRNAKAPRGLILMLHGCTQTPDDFAAGTRMNAVAQANNLLVAYPEQTRSANGSLCWNWFEPKDQGRETGEPAILAGIARAVAAEFGLDDACLFVAGLSAGGAMAAVLAETYPDLFAAVGIHSGLAYGSAHDVGSALTAMRGVFVHGTPVRPAMPEEADLLARGVPAIVFHGDADHTVHKSNAEAIVAQIEAREIGLKPLTEQGTAPGGRRYVKTMGLDRSGVTRFEHWTVLGAGHAWSGGSKAGSYTDPTGPDASAEMVRFFLEQAQPR